MLSTVETTNVRDLVGFALDVLPSTRRESGLYCYDRPFEDSRPRGESLRYSLIVLLGLQRAEAAGLPVDVDVDALYELCMRRRALFTPGDIGLALWADARRGGGRAAGLVEQLERVTSGADDLAPLAGLEIAWIIIGLAHAFDDAKRAPVVLELVTKHLRNERQAPSGLYYHDAASKFRRHLPNFATEIYTLLALSVLARRFGVRRSLHDAERLGQHLLRLQLADGAWPWLFDADRATVVERYELYSVHQDAMAPMALLELAAATGDESYVRAAVSGLAWSNGANELGFDLLDTTSGFAHRSIRRTVPWHRLALVSNSVATRTAGRPLKESGTAVEVNRTCRPYHLGWILEAWAEGKVRTDA